MTLSSEDRAEIRKRVLDEFPYPEKCCPEKKTKINGLRHMAKRYYEQEKKKEYANSANNNIGS